MHPGFATSSQLQSHIRKEHTVTVCIFCDKECANEKQLQTHVESQHSGISLAERKRVECTYDGCGKTFTRKSNLDAHIRTTHEGERFICGEFDTSDSLGLEGFQPDAGCGQDFFSKQYLEDHIRIAHLGQPSLVNSRRPKVKQSTDEFASFVDDEDEDDTYTPMPKSRRKQRKDKHSAFQAMTGIGSAAAFELGVQTPYDTPASWPTTPGFDNESLPGDMLGDVDWQLEQQALQGGQFWIGGVNSFSASNYDPWNQDESEMQRLVGDEH